MQGFGSLPEHSGGDEMSVMGSVINHGRNRNVYSPGCVTSSEKRSCSPVCPGSSEGLSPSVTVQTEEMVWERLGGNSTSAQQTAVIARHFCHRGV